MECPPVRSAVIAVSTDDNNVVGSSAMQKEYNLADMVIAVFVYRRGLLISAHKKTPPVKAGLGWLLPFFKPLVSLKLGVFISTEAAV